MFASPFTSTPAIALNGIVERAVNTVPSTTSYGSTNEPLATSA